eukprot:scaffold12522_cov146-Isochrysis_galbana.AAC.2
MHVRERNQRYSGGGSIPPLPCETESMRPSGAVRARADKAHDRHDRKCLEGSLNMTRGHTRSQTQAHRVTPRYIKRIRRWAG